jgi:hypothetical protein
MRQQGQSNINVYLLLFRGILLLLSWECNGAYKKTDSPVLSSSSKSLICNIVSEKYAPNEVRDSMIFDNFINRHNYKIIKTNPTVNKYTSLSDTIKTIQVFNSSFEFYYASDKIFLQEAWIKDTAFKINNALTIGMTLTELQILLNLNSDECSEIIIINEEDTSRVELFLKDNTIISMHLLFYAE